MTDERELTTTDPQDIMGEIITRELRDKSGKLFIKERHHYFTAKIIFPTGNTGYVTNEVFQTHADGYKEPLIITDLLVAEVFEY